MNISLKPLNKPSKVDMSNFHRLFFWTLYKVNSAFVAVSLGIESEKRARRLVKT